MSKLSGTSFSQNQQFQRQEPRRVWGEGELGYRGGGHWGIGGQGIKGAGPNYASMTTNLAIVFPGQLLKNASVRRYGPRSLAQASGPWTLAHLFAAICCNSLLHR